MSPNDDMVVRGVREFYERWVAEVDKSDPQTSRTLPAWSNLDGEQVIAWTGAYGATVETSARMSAAVMSVLSAQR